MSEETTSNIDAEEVDDDDINADNIDVTSLNLQAYYENDL